MDAMLATLKQLPVLPAAVLEVIASFNDPDLDNHELARKIGRDQGLSARMLRLANSPFYGLPRQVASIQDAVMVLGFASVRSLALAAGIAGAFPTTSATFAWQDYWRRSMLAGRYARALASCLNVDGETAFSAGLFHEIGLAALACSAPDQLARAKAAAGEGDLLAAECVLFGFDHAQLGGEVARHWNFPAAIEQAIRHHRGPPTATGPLLDRVIHAAYLMSRAAPNQSDVSLCLDDHLLALLGLDREVLCRCLPPAEDLEVACSALLQR